jgi:uncharacterized protein
MMLMNHSKSAISRLAATLIFGMIAFASPGLSSAQAGARPPGAPSPVFNGGQAQLQRTQLRAGMFLISAEVADSPQSRANGLMMRTKMATNEGMLFVFEKADPQCFWMRNTLLPLSIAFLDEEGTILNIADMQPKSDDSHCSAKPAKYALEMNQGWFKAKGIAAGAKIAGVTK